jgi:hypothetical protein
MAMLADGPGGELPMEVLQVRSLKGARAAMSRPSRRGAARTGGPGRRVRGGWRPPGPPARRARPPAARNWRRQPGRLAEPGAGPHARPAATAARGGRAPAAAAASAPDWPRRASRRARRPRAPPGSPRPARPTRRTLPPAPAPTPTPPQGLREWLSPADLRAARLVCRHWAAELGAAVNTVALPASLWQGSLPPEAIRSQADAATHAAGAAASLLGSANSDPDLREAALSFAAPRGGGRRRGGAPKLTSYASMPAPFSAGGGGAAGGGGIPAARGARSAGGVPPDGGAFANPWERRAMEHERARRQALGRLARAFPTARAARLTAEAGRPFDKAAASEAFARLGELRGVSRLSLLRLSGDAAWSAALGALLAPAAAGAAARAAAARAKAAAAAERAAARAGAGHGSGSDDDDTVMDLDQRRAAARAADADVDTSLLSPPLARRLTALSLLDAGLPGPAGLDALARARPGGALGALRVLELSATGGGRLEAGHLAALAGLPALRTLRLAFRVAAGGWREPLLLDPLGRLAALEELAVEFTGEWRWQWQGVLGGVGRAARAACAPRSGGAGGGARVGGADAEPRRPARSRGSTDPPQSRPAARPPAGCPKTPGAGRWSWAGSPPRPAAQTGPRSTCRRRPHGSTPVTPTRAPVTPPRAPVTPPPDRN